MYELAGRYKNSLLLNFAIHKILMQPGREKEVRLWARVWGWACGAGHVWGWTWVGAHVQV